MPSRNPSVYNKVPIRFLDTPIYIRITYYYTLNPYKKLIKLKIYKYKSSTLISEYVIIETWILVLTLNLKKTIIVLNIYLYVYVYFIQNSNTNISFKIIMHICKQRSVYRGKSVHKCTVSGIIHKLTLYTSNTFIIILRCSAILVSKPQTQSFLLQSNHLPYPGQQVLRSACKSFRQRW